MATTILASLLSKSKVTFVDSDTGLILFNGFTVIEVPQAVYPARTADYPVHQLLSTDYGSVSGIVGPSEQSSLATGLAPIKVLDPVKLRLVGLVSDFSVMRAMIQYAKMKNSLIDVTSKSMNLSQMAIVNLVIEQSPEKMSVNTVTLELEQVTKPEQAGFDPVQPADASRGGVRSIIPTIAASTIDSLF